MKAAMLLIVSAALGACYGPSFDEPRCGAAGECPSGLECLNGVCVSPQIAGPADGRTRGPDTGPPCFAWSATHLDPCDERLPVPESLTLAEGRFTYDTSTGVVAGIIGVVPSAVLEQSDGSTLRVVNLTALTITSDVTIHIVGAEPLLIAVHGDARFDGTLIVSSTVAPTPVPGPGASDAACVGQLGAPGGLGTGTTGAGGGGGGALSHSGGWGSAGAEAWAGLRGDAGGTAADLDLSPLHGGCRGGKGGDSAAFAGDSGGLAGQGGGAIAITVRGALTVGGQIAANGSAGRGGGQRSGGGGGGSGGAILLEAATVTLTEEASLCANGGGGGEGGTGEPLGNGEDGQDGRCATVEALGGGALAGDTGGDGGSGGALYEEAGQDADYAVDGSGGGGGGGSTGYIRIRGLAASPVVDRALFISPTPVID